MNPLVQITRDLFWSRYAGNMTHEELEGRLSDLYDAQLKFGGKYEPTVTSNDQRSSPEQPQDVKTAQERTSGTLREAQSQLIGTGEK